MKSLRASFASSQREHCSLVNITRFGNICFVDKASCLTGFNMVILTMGHIWTMILVNFFTTIFVSVEPEKLKKMIQVRPEFFLSKLCLQTPPTLNSLVLEKNKTEI